MAQYFFLATALPALEIGMAPEISYDELQNLLKDNLLPADFKQVQILQRYYDILNLRALWRKDALDRYGNLDENELSEAVVEFIPFPKYVRVFLENYPTKEERLAHFPLLLSEFFKEELKQTNHFLRKYFEFERELRLVLVGFRAKALGRNLAVELQYEDPEETLIAQIMAQKDAEEFDPPEGFEELKTLFSTYYDHPQEMYQILSRYRFDAVERMKGQNVFSFSGILGYLIQFILIQQWQDLNKKKGIEIIDQILRGQE